MNQSPMNQNINTSQNIVCNNGKNLGYAKQAGRNSYGGNSYTNNNGGYSNTMGNNGPQKSSGYGLKSTKLNSSAIIHN